MVLPNLVVFVHLVLGVAHHEASEARAQTRTLEQLGLSALSRLLLLFLLFLRLHERLMLALDMETQSVLVITLIVGALCVVSLSTTCDTACKVCNQSMLASGKEGCGAVSRGKNEGLPNKVAASVCASHLSLLVIIPLATLPHNLSRTMFPSVVFTTIIRM